MNTSRPRPRTGRSHMDHTIVGCLGRCVRANGLTLLAMGIAICAATTGCQLFEGRDPTTTPHPQLERLWKDYEKLPDERALAIAGDPERRWVAGASGSHSTRESAREAALAECGKRRQRQRMREMCRIYAEGAKIVWTGW